MIFKVAPEETEDDEEAKIAVVWEFDHARGMTAAAYAVHPEEKPADGLVIMPRLVFGKVNCNCTRFPHLGDVIVSSRDETETVSQYLQNLDLGSESNGEEDLSDSENQELSSGDSDETDADNVELFTETMNLKGSSCHSSFQSHCKEALMKKEAVTVCLRFKPTNRRDQNAIVVHVKLGQSGSEQLWNPIGYIPGSKVPKVTIALRNNEVQLVTVKNVFYQYVPPINDFKFFLSIAVSKMGRWLQNKNDYKYNESI